MYIKLIFTNQTSVLFPSKKYDMYLLTLFYINVFFKCRDFIPYIVFYATAGDLCG